MFQLKGPRKLTHKSK